MTKELATLTHPETGFMRPHHLFPFSFEEFLPSMNDPAALEAFLEELALFLDENPAREDRYRESGAAYAKWAALDLATDGMIEPALRMFELSLRLNPDDHDIRLAYAVALHSREYRAETLDQYAILMADAPLNKYWRPWMLAAEIHAVQGNYALARNLMEQAVFAWPEDGRFWGFLGELQDRTQPPARPPCATCGAEVEQGHRFCGHCGSPHGG